MENNPNTENHFALNLVALRKIKGITQSNLAEYLGKKKSSISSYENGNSRPDLDDLIKLADFFRVDLNTLVTQDFKGYSGIESSEILVLTEPTDLLRLMSNLRTLYGLEMIRDNGNDDLVSKVLCPGTISSIIEECIKIAKEVKIHSNGRSSD